MKSDEILIIQYPYKMSQQRVNVLRENILKQKESGVILLADFCTVITKPKDIEVQVELEEDKPTPWVFVNNPCYSSIDPSSKESSLFCDECGITIRNWDALYTCCPYCGKKHTFGASEEVEHE